MKITKKFDEKLCEKIARESGSKAVRQSIAYLRRAFFNNKNTFVCNIIDDKAFYAGNCGKTHFRLYEIAVVEDAQRNGYGKLMMLQIKQLCQKKGLTKITLRTSKSETAIDFWRKCGGVIVGENGNDYEVEIKA